DAHEWLAVDGFDRPDAQPQPVDGAYGDGMQTERIRPIRRPRREDAGDRIARIRPRPHLVDVAASSIQPGNDQQLVAGRDAQQRCLSPWLDLEPRVRPA